MGILNYGFEFLDINLIQIVANKFNFGYNLLNVFKLLILIFGLYIFFIDGYIWTPFLGDAVIPSILFNKEPPKKYNLILPIQVAPNSKVIYWAAHNNESENTQMVWEAYGDYSNSGVIYSDENGNAKLKLNYPAPYLLPSKNKLYPHVHYRVCNNNQNKQIEEMIGPIETIYL